MSISRNEKRDFWLLTQWESLTASVGADEAGAESVWDELVRRYNEPHRTYHNLSHVAGLLRHADRYRSHLRHPETVGFAIWFHDVIYDPQSSDNEVRSVEWARCAMSAMQIDERFIPPVMACIAATQNHQVTVPEVSDLPLFLDLDLSILGADEATYRQYCDAIRAEYRHVPDEQYRAARSQILQGFLDRPALYFAPVMQDAFEQSARRNLEEELRMLAQPNSFS